jgi:hypothetical protein
VAGGRLTRAPTAVALASAGDWRQRSALRLITFAAFVEPPAPLKERALGDSTRALDLPPPSFMCGSAPKVIRSVFRSRAVVR